MEKGGNVNARKERAVHLPLGRVEACESGVGGREVVDR
jgi:hypothetical protein